MFRIEVICHNNKLEKVMWALVGLVVGHPKVIPLRLEDGSEHESAENGDGTPVEAGHQVEFRSKRGSGTNVLPLKAAAWLLQNPPERITIHNLREAMATVGSDTPSYMIKWLRDHKAIEGPKDGEFKLNVAKLSQLLGHQETPASRGITPPLPAYRQKILNAPERFPFDETLPGRVIKALVTSGVSAVDANRLRDAITAADGHIGSLYHVVLKLQKYKLLSDRSLDETYTVDAERYRHMMASQTNPE